IEIADDGVLSYEAYERGLQVFCYAFTDLDGLMYHVFKDIAPQLASDYATKMEAGGQDFSQHFFNKKMELMSKVKAEWGQRMKDEYLARE
ncbi:MAG: Imm63 family immunity protein, partial [Cyclobacteriaceae bacterium]